VLKEGAIQEYELTLGAAPTATPLRTMRVPSQPEGCVADPRDGTLYIGEEVGGIWRFPAGATAGELVLPVENQYLVADVEGLALLPVGANGGYLVASSQGDNAYAVFRLPDLAPLGRFAITDGTFGGAEETDGIELAAGSFGPDFPDGLFVAQDGHNQPQAQNFKLVSWAAIKAALGL
jgi:3-phytase